MSVSKLSHNTLFTQKPNSNSHRKSSQYIFFFWQVENVLEISLLSVVFAQNQYHLIKEKAVTLLSNFVLLVFRFLGNRDSMIAHEVLIGFIDQCHFGE